MVGDGVEDVSKLLKLPKSALVEDAVAVAFAVAFAFRAGDTTGTTGGEGDDDPGEAPALFAANRLAAALFGFNCTGARCGT